MIKKSLPLICSLLFAFLLPLTAQSLPKGLVWQTNNKEPIFDYKPKKGGTLRLYISSFPQTFRLYGPNSNSGGFVSFNRRWAFLSLTSRHANTHKIIPELATDWFIEDQKTVYYKLDNKATWSDGKKITADDYLFSYEFLKSPHIQSPFYNSYIENHIESVQKIDDYTIKITLKNPSWQILDQANVIMPLPKHVIKLDENWVKNSQWQPNVVSGPYVITDFKKGSYILFERNKNWWGYNKRYFKNKFNFDKVRLDVIQTTETAYEAFKKGSLSIFNPSALIWANKTNIDDIKNGYILKQRIFIKQVVGPRGIFINTQSPIWQDKKLRQAFAYTIDFKGINRNFLYGLFKRLENFFTVLPPYFKEGMKTYPFDLNQANKLLEEAGWARNKTTGFREKDGQQLLFTIITGSDEALRYLPFIKQTSAKAGIFVDIRKYDGAQFFDLINNRNFDGALLSFGGGYFPSPRQMLHTENIKKSTNNIFMFGNSNIDKLIETYEFDLKEQNRIKAIYQIEDEVKENAVLVPSWVEASDRILWWRFIKGPKEMIYKTGLDIDILWYSADEDAKLKQAIKSKDKFKPLALEYDPYNLKNN